jgi:tRNA(fMet)-specific endonuclease VapC
LTVFLDTNICIYALDGSYPSLRKRFQQVQPARIKIPSIVQGELYFGAAKSQSPNETRETIESFLMPFEIVPFGKEASNVYAEIRAELERSGEPIGPNDLIIAAVVLANDGTLITHNTAEFERVSNLPTDDWTQSD